MESDNSWTAVGKGGRAISFPSEAAVAFGGKFRSYREPPSRAHGGPCSEFTAEAAAAFGRKSRSNARPFGDSGKSWMGVPESGTAYDDGASAAFGSKARRGGSEFDAAAAAAFGGKSSNRRAAPDCRGNFPDAFGKKKSAFAAETGDGREGYMLSAFGRKRAEAERPPEPTYEEMFPSLGAVPLVAPKATKPTGKPTLAEMMRKRVAEEEAEAEHMARVEKERLDKERIDAVERARIRRLRSLRGHNYVSYAEDEDDVPVDEYTPGDLDYDAYGVTRKELTIQERPLDMLDNSSEDNDEAAEANDY